MPSESLVIGLAAIAAATGEPNVWLVLLAGASGAAIGDLTAYALGRRVGTRRFAWMTLRKYLPLSLTAAIVWSTFSVGVGLLGGTWMHERPLLALVLVIAQGMVLGTLVDRLVQRFTLDPVPEEHTLPDMIER